MSKTTTNYGLIKPELTDVADITATNENWDKIDAELKRQASETVDVSTPINNHNTSGSAHSDIRTAVTEAKQSASQALTEAKAYTDQKVANIPTPDVSGQINTHNSSSTAHNDIRQLIANKKGAVVYTATIGTSWTEDTNTGVKSQNVAISGITADNTAKVDHVYTGNGTSEAYATFVTAENQYLDCITNGYAETYNGGIKFHIFGDANTVNIPIVVEVV